MAAIPQSREFFIALESLRGLAALGVVLLHVAFAWTFPLYDLGLIRNSYLLVDLFFVLSGFVICHSYGNRIETGRDAARFMWVRLGRLYPLHLTFLFVFLGFEIVKYFGETYYGLIAHTTAFTSNNAFAFLSNVLLIQGLGVQEKETFNLPSWSISTELYTYVLFAAVLLLFKSRTTICLISGFLIGASMLLDSGTLDHNFFRCIEGFFLGVITYHSYAAFLTRRALSGDHSWGRDLPGILTFTGLLMFLSTKHGNSLDAFVLPLAAGLILSIAMIPKGRLSTFLEAAPLAWLGRISYSVYMVHMAVIWLFCQVMRLGLHTPRIIDLNGDPLLTPHPLIGLLFLIAAVACILLLSHLTYAYIEEPCRRASKRIAEQWFPPCRATFADTLIPPMCVDYSAPEHVHLKQRRL
jgi:peptidoglycan/LPS O-acetylase OafA/YrhL